MEQHERIAMSTAYIEEHLKETLTVKQLSAQAGYSPGHFSRCFKEMLGVSPMEFVKQRRLTAAAKEICRGRRILDAALDYGWETHSGFTKAFGFQFGYSPVFLRAFYVRDASLKGETMELYKTPEELWQVLCITLEENGVKYDRERLKEIYELAAAFHEGQKRRSGEDYITHPLNVAVILADMGADEDTVCAGLLHEVTESGNLKDGLLKMEPGIFKVLSAYKDFKQTFSCEDDRGALVALSDRLHNMRTIKFVDPSTWKRRAEETLKLFSPIAARCGDFKLRSELDELSLKLL